MCVGSPQEATTQLWCNGSTREKKNKNAQTPLDMRMRFCFITGEPPRLIASMDNRSTHAAIMTRMCATARTHIWMCVHVRGAQIQGCACVLVLKKKQNSEQFWLFTTHPRAWREVKTTPKEAKMKPKDPKGSVQPA